MADENDDGTESPEPPEGAKRIGESDEPPEGIKFLAENDLDWMTKTDVLILKTLAYELTLTPSVIAENIDRSRETVSRRLNALQAGGLVEKIDRGKYKITGDGMLSYEGKSLSAEEIPELEDVGK